MKSFPIYWKGNAWRYTLWRQQSIMLSISRTRWMWSFGPFIRGRGLFPADGFWRVHRWFNVRFYNVPTLGLGFSLNDRQLTVGVGLLLFYVKFDFGRLESVPEWMAYLRRIECP